MGFYDNVILPHCIELSCGMRALIPARKQVCAGLFGRVLEIGFGSGLNVPYYPAEVTEVRGVDPSARALRIGEKRLRAAACKIEMVSLDAQAIAVEDGWADAALSTFTLCTIAEPQIALAEVIRILKPKGRLHFLEHGRAPDESVARWQDRLNGLQQVVAGGCQLNRDMASLLKTAGFTIDSLEQAYHPAMPRTHGYLYQGIATRP